MLYLKQSYNRYFMWILAVLLVNANRLGLVSIAYGTGSKYFRIQVVDEQTGRGVPLVELRTVNNIRYLTDSNGIVAFYEPGLMNQAVFFHVESHGHEFSKDGFGFTGKRFHVKAGDSAILKVKRINIAERLYRITGQGIYRDSILTNQSVPLKEPLLNGLVMGQDSVNTCIYRGRLFWFWGDTTKPSYPLGNFATSGAVSNLPDCGGLDPSIGVNLHYFVDDKGFAKKMCPLPERGLVWLEGLFTVNDEQGNERLIAKYNRMKSLGEAYERGLAIYNDKTNCFERLVKGCPDFFLFPGVGHPFCVDADSRPYYYFATPFPLAVRLRVKADWQHIIDPNAYEIYTSLSIDHLANSDESRDLKADKSLRWITTRDLLAGKQYPKKVLIDALRKEKEAAPLYDIETGKVVSPHAGTVYWNSFRRRWVMIAVQQFGQPSFLGEVWYAEADTPVGPWAYARKIVTHNKYSFYNPKHHPYFDQDGGRLIYFEGTYSHMFSGNPANATPRYNYNQIMYRLTLDGPRLSLPVAVYQLRDSTGRIDYLLREDVDAQNKWATVETIPFFAIPPNTAYDGLIPIYTDQASTAAGSAVRLMTSPPAKSQKPIFYALTAENSSSTAQLPITVLLYEYRNEDTGKLIYSTDSNLHREKSTASPEPICRVWKAPPGPLMLDRQAKPAGTK